MFADYSSKFIYIDGTDVATEGTFVSNETGTELRYKNWHRGEPNNHRDEDCINIYADIGKWNDIPCGLNLPAVCEIESEFIQADKLKSIKSSFKFHKTLCKVVARRETGRGACGVA